MNETSPMMAFCNASWTPREPTTVSHIHPQFYVEVYRIVWSPKICVFERRENLREINDLKYSLYERVVTFEGEEFHSRLCKEMLSLTFLVPLKGSLVPNRLNNIANSIA